MRLTRTISRMRRQISLASEGFRMYRYHWIMRARKSNSNARIYRKLNRRRYENLARFSFKSLIWPAGTPGHTASRWWPTSLPDHSVLCIYRRNGTVRLFGKVEVISGRSPELICVGCCEPREPHRWSLEAEPPGARSQAGARERDEPAWRPVATMKQGTAKSPLKQSKKIQFLVHRTQRDNRILAGDQQLLRYFNHIF